jgi:ADP-ribose pyrophosphatase YjhB (NUDIX family)
MAQKSLHLGANCAVIDDAGRILLSHRADFDLWNLPGGRLDPGEGLDAAAAREVREETGVHVQIERAVGLYYAAGLGRMTVTFAGRPVGGQLLGRSDETRDNRYFARDELPASNHIRVMTLDALSDDRPPPTVILRTPAELRRMRWRLRRRYVANLLRGRPEPRWARFNVWATAIIWERGTGRVLTISNQRMRALPRVYCDGMAAPWAGLAGLARQFHPGVDAWGWVGYWQDMQTDSVEFVFAAQAEANGRALTGGAAWSSAQNAALNQRDAAYLARTTPDYAASPAWWLYAGADHAMGETIIVTHNAKG